MIVPYELLQTVANAIDWNLLVGFMLGMLYAVYLVARRS